MSSICRLAFGAIAAATLALTCVAAGAQTWPSKPITIIVSFPPGGDSDALARVFAEKLTTRIGQRVVVENRTGASGTIGNSFVAKSPADGHTLLFTPNTMTTAPLVLKPGTGATYDVINDLEPVILMGRSSMFVVVNAASGIQNIRELVAAAKAGKVPDYASPGSGSPMHILGALFNRNTGADIKQVPYRGSGPAIIDLVAGHVQLMYTTLGPVAQHIAVGKLRNLGVASPQRSPLAPDVPTLAESGVLDSEVIGWQGFFAPRATPAPIVRSLNEHFNEMLKMPDVLARMQTLALAPAGGDPAVLRRLVAVDYERYAKLIKELGIQAD
ncbi:MAG: Bug family tripartite tricarboxylate transporter substrate binding protein [Burkholderiales bacterium]